MSRYAPGKIIGGIARGTASYILMYILARATLDCYRDERGVPLGKRLMREEGMSLLDMIKSEVRIAT